MMSDEQQVCGSEIVSYRKIACAVVGEFILS